MKITSLLIAFTFSLLAACSGEEGNTDSKISVQEPLLKARRQAIEKAKGVEALLQNSVDQQKLMIDEQAR